MEYVYCLNECLHKVFDISACDRCFAISFIQHMFAYLVTLTFQVSKVIDEFLYKSVQLQS